MRLQPCDIFAVEENFPYVRHVDPCDEVEYRRLPGAIGADQPQNLPCLDIEIQLTYGH